ncbi:MAG: hypothetical protein VKP72_11435 [bacterium]|nr:hypothetical protein [bacterium]
MSRRRLSRSLTASTIVACLGVLVACQAPGFMGLNQDASLGPSRPDERLVRVRFRVLVPETLGRGMAIQSIPSPEATQGGWTTDERSIIGATVMIDGPRGASDVTDEQGLATLALPSGRVIPIRAEFQTPRGKVSLTTLAWASTEVERVPSILVSLPAALVTARLATRFASKDLARLDRERYLAAIRTLDARMRDESGRFDPRWLPASGLGWGMADLAAWLLRLRPVLDDLTTDLVPAGVSAAGEAHPVPSSTPSVVPAGFRIPLKASAAPDRAEWTLADLGLREELTLEGTASLPGHSQEARFRRHLGKPGRRGGSLVFRGTDTLFLAEATRSWHFLVRVGPERIRWAHPGLEPIDLAWPPVAPIASGSELVLERGLGTGRQDVYRTGDGPIRLSITEPRSRQTWTVWLDEAASTPSASPSTSHAHVRETPPPTTR